jgi:hypothetical protein
LVVSIYKPHKYDDDDDDDDDDNNNNNEDCGVCHVTECGLSPWIFFPSHSEITKDEVLEHTQL